MNKWVIGVIIAVLVLAGVGYFLLAPPSVSAAILYIESGDVQVNTGKGWQTATDEMELEQGAQVKTAEGEATVVLQEGEIVHLQPNTEIKLDSISGKSIKLTQIAGETWNKITKISGISEFSIETPNTVATVRGTEFMLNNAQLDVVDGDVEYEKKADKKKMHVRAKKKAMADKMQEEDMTDTDFAKMQKFSSMEIKVLKKVRAREIKKHGRMLKMAQKKGYTEQQMEQTLNDMDEGRQNEDELYNQAPALMKPRAKRTYLLTKEIKRATERAKK
jgi:hypothetical protein